MASWEQIAKRAEKNYKKLYKKFEQYKKESIKWSIEDFTELEVDGWEISNKKAQEALEYMIRKHDAGIGINWGTIESYYQDYGKEVEVGKERWRQLYEIEPEKGDKF